MTFIEWFVLIVLCLLSMAVGLVITLRQKAKGEEGFFTANRNLPWWAVGISNSATYQSGLGAFVMLIFAFGLSGNWLWWTSWIIWMPLVAIIWARMWRRMQIVTTAELISLRYGGKTAVIARKIYAFSMFLFAVTLMAYITGLFSRTISPVLDMSEVQILLLFGGITALYTMLGGLMGSVAVAVVQFIIMMIGSVLFLFIIIPQHGGWHAILARVHTIRPEALTLSPVTSQISLGSILMFIVLGFFFAGSPTAGEGMTAQRFMSARNERHAMGGQLFNAVIALSLRIIPLVGLGIVALSLFWSKELTEQIGPAPEGVKFIEKPAYAWGELINASKFPKGFVGMLIATEVAAFMSTLSAQMNWGSSFIVNDFYKSFFPNTSERNQVWVSRIVTLCLFMFAAMVAILFVDNMVSWFIFINSVVVIFWLPLAYFRFFWDRFNVWGELAATILGLPLAYLIWFVLGFEDKPIWMGTGILFATAMTTLIIVTLLTPKEKDETLVRFFERCRPLAGWKNIRKLAKPSTFSEPSLGELIITSALGMLACLGLTVATNSVFVQNWLLFVICAIVAIVSAAGLLYRLSGSEKRRDQSEIMPLEVSGDLQ